jgi:low temperature requirement protein LtrA
MGRFSFRRLISPPSLHQDWGKEQAQRKVTWTELFFDLFYVVSSAQVTHLVIDHPDATYTGYFVLYYTVFWWTWIKHSMFVTRFKLDGFVWDLLHLSYMIGVAGMIIHADYPENYARFAVGYVIAKVCYLSMHMSMFFHAERARASSGAALLLYTCTTALAVASVFFSKQTFVALFITILVLETTIPFVGESHESALTRCVGGGMLAGMSCRLFSCICMLLYQQWMQTALCDQRCCMAS